MPTLRLSHVGGMCFSCGRMEACAKGRKPAELRSAANLLYAQFFLFGGGANHFELALRFGLPSTNLLG